MIYQNYRFLPKGLIRLSSLIIFFICFTIILITTTYEWPSSVEGRFSLTKGNRAYSVKNSIKGEVSFLTRSSNIVKANEPIAFIEGHGDYQAILKLKYLLDRIESNNIIDIPLDYYYGDISQFVYNYASSIQDYRLYKESKIIKIKISSITSKISTLKDKFSYLQKLKLNIIDEIEILKKQAVSDSLLLLKGAVTQADANRSKLLYLQKQGELLNYNAEILATSNAVIDNSNEKQVLLYSMIEETIKFENNVKKKYSELKNAISDWCNHYELKSPVNGILENPLRINNHEIVDINTEIFRVLPIGDLIEGDVYFSALKSYGINENMPVKLILDDYNENEYGYLIGKITDISSSVLRTNDGSGYTCTVIINLSEQSTFHAPLVFKYGMGGIVKFNIKQKSIWEKLILWISRQI